MNFDILLTNPELAKNIKFEISGSDLLELSATLINATRNLPNQNQNQNEVYLTVKEVCVLVNRDRRTLSTWHKSGILKHNQIGLYKKSEVDKFMEKR